MASYTIAVIDKADRLARIAEEIKNPLRTQPMVIRDKNSELPVIRMPLELPIYRMRNWRTDLEQLDHCRSKGLPENYFDDSDEDVEAQRIQHGILLRMSKDPGAPIYQELERAKWQTESLLVTSTGVMVNGNRRLAAMRDLYTSNPSLYASYSNVDLTVLPDWVTEKDIELLEDDLQLAPDTRQDYNWISRRRKLRHETETLGIPRDDVKRHYRFTRDEQLNRELAQLELAEEYLEEYIGEARNYRLVEDNEQMFKELQQALEGKDPEKQRLAKKVGFPLIKESRELGSRAYDYKIAFGKQMEEVLTTLAKEEGIALDQDTTIVLEETPSEDPLDSFTGNGTERFADLEDILSDPDNSGQVAMKIVTICRSMKDAKSQEDKSHAALRQVKSANTDLSSIDLSMADREDLDQIKAQLENVVLLSERLLEEVDKLTK